MNEEMETLEPVEMDENRAKPAATLHGNAYDMTALGALASGALLLFLCLTCNMGFYCLPFFPLILGILGVATAHHAVNRGQSRAMAWAGLGSGLLVFLIMIAGMLLYIGLIVLVILSESSF